MAPGPRPQPRSPDPGPVGDVDQRLLAHTGEPVATVARRLGFAEPTDFGKFFTRHTGLTPGAFRTTHQGGWVC